MEINLTLLVVDLESNLERNELAFYLERTAATVTILTELPDILNQYDAIIVTNIGLLSPRSWDCLGHFVADGGICLYFAMPEEVGMPTMFGAQTVAPGPEVELRVLFRNINSQLAQRLPEAFYVRDTYQAIIPDSPETTVVLYADWRYTQQPVLTTNQFGKGTAALTTLRDKGNPLLHRIIYRLLLQLNQPELTTKTLGVGLLGYAPSVGQLHANGIVATSGLALQSVCDLDPARLASARAQLPAVHLTQSADDLINCPEIDLVIIATPPNSHARLAELMLARGKHVICEKPLALSLAEAKSMQTTAKQYGRHLSCHQNRRWDSDYRMIKQAVADGLLGEPFYLETYVGGFGHPCGFWHSHEAISGGTTFDWGAHYLDWVIDLLPGTITGVICTRQNRLWHDITNADRERIQLRYADGTEAEFTHSDLAFIPKPKWYLVGTEGALVGNWRQEDALEIDPIHYYQKHEIPASELGASITLRRRDSQGGLYERNLPEPKQLLYPFHMNLADHLLLGEPIEAPLDHTMRVMAVLEAARSSAEHDGQLIKVNI